MLSENRDLLLEFEPLNARDVGICPYFPPLDMCHSLLSFPRIPLAISKRAGLPKCKLKYLGARTLWLFSGWVQCTELCLELVFMSFFLLNVERILNIRLGIGNFSLGNCPTCRPGAGSGTLHSGL